MKKWLITLILKKRRSFLDEDVVELRTKETLENEFTDKDYRAIVSFIMVKEIEEEK